MVRLHDNFHYNFNNRQAARGMIPDSYHSYSLFKAFLQVINNHHAKKKLKGGKHTTTTILIIHRPS
jgi:hypothetical protein